MVTTDFVVIPRDCAIRAQQDRLQLVPQPHIASDSWQVFGVGGPIAYSRGKSNAYTIVLSSDVEAEQVASNVAFRARRFALRPNDTGVYAATTFYRDRADLLAWTSRPAVRRIYWTTTSAGPIIGTHPRIVARVAAVVDNQRPVVPSMDYARSILIWGYPMDGATPYAGVNTLGIHELLHAGVDGVRIVPLTRSPRKSLKRASENEKAALLVDAITASIYRIPSDQEPLLRLSGGKDSRVLLAALSALGRKSTTQTRGKPTDTEVRIASALAQSVGLDHFISGTPLSVPGDVPESVLHTFERTGGFIPSESHQSPYVGAHPRDPGQALLIGQSHVQRGGFARTMRTDVPATMYGQASRHVSQDLIDYGMSYVDGWSQRNQRANDLEQLYEFHVQHRASTYLSAHLVDYSAEARPVYPMIDARFVAICDQLTLFDKLSERVIYLAAQQMAPQVVRIPLTTGNWRFNPKIIGVEEFLSGTIDDSARYSIYEAPREPFYPSTSTGSVHQIAAELVNSATYSELRPMIDRDFADKLERTPAEGMELAFADVDGRSLLDEKKFVWRIYNAGLWLEHFHRWA